MKRYLLFSGAYYYPSPGWDDFQGDFYSIEEAKEKADKDNDEWIQIVDLETREVIIS